MPRPSLQSVYQRLPVVAQEWVVTAAGYSSYRKRFGAPFRRVLSELQRTDLFDADRVRADQERRLRDQILWSVKTVPYYRTLFREEGIDPASIRGLDDLPRVPFLTKEAVRGAGPKLTSDAVPASEIIPAHTSGTTGTGLTLYHTREALGWEYGVIWRQRGWYGMQLGDRFASFGGQNVVPLEQESPPYWRYDRARARMIFSLYHMKPDSLPDYARELCGPGYRFWQGYPSSLGLVSRSILDGDVSLGDAAPEVVFPSSETLLDFHREAIERATGAIIADRYGNSEFSVSAVQCPEGRYHVDTEFGVVEIDRHEEGDGWVRGEVISTGFASRAMPFLRYRTGDVATLRTDVTCSCGRSRPVLERIDGRIEDFVVTPDGRRIGRMDHVFKDALEIKEAQIQQSHPNRIVVLLVPRAGFDEAARRLLDLEFRKRLGRDIEIEYQVAQAIPRSASGKFRAVVSQIDGLDAVESSTQ